MSTFFSRRSSLAAAGASATMAGGAEGVIGAGAGSGTRVTRRLVARRGGSGRLLVGGLRRGRGFRHRRNRRRTGLRRSLSRRLNRCRCLGRRSRSPDPRLAIELRIGNRFAMPQHRHEGRHEHGRKGRIPGHARTRLAATGQQATPPRRGSRTVGRGTRRRHRRRGQVVRHLANGVARAGIGRGLAVGGVVQRAAQHRVAQIAVTGVVTVAVETDGGVVAAAAHARCSSTDR
jgi:hypothetical protein